MERRLAAIMAADLVGFSTLVEKDETATLDQLKTVRDEIILPTIARHRGRLFKQMGDGFFVEFSSAVNAVNCAVDWQSRVAETQKSSFRFRIGLHIGDVTVEADDLLGDGVNVAARLEQISPSGGIAMSDSFHEQIAGKVKLSIREAGAPKLKNLERVRNIWLVDLVFVEGVENVPNPQSLINEDAPSMAVLPFKNLTGDASLEYLALGMADQLATDLGHVPWFFVSAQAASFSLGQGSIPSVEIGRQLGVRYLIDGALQKAGNRLRVSVKLVLSEKARQIWASSLTGSEDQVFELQDQLVRSVVGEIEPRMRQIEIGRSKEKHGNLTAFDFYLRALPHIRGMTKGEFDRGLVLLEEAIRHYPAYPAAHGLIAWLMTLRIPQGHSVELEKGIWHAEEAIRHGALDSEALSSGGYSLGFFRREPELGLGYLREAYALNPNSARTHDFMGWLLLYAGRAEEALEYFEDSLRLSPVDEFAFRPYAGKAFALLFLGRPYEAIDMARKALTANPNFTVCHRVLAPALVQIGNEEEAKNIIADLQRLHPALTVARFASETRFVDSQYRKLLLEGLHAAGLPE